MHATDYVNSSSILLKDKAYVEIKELILNEKFQPNQFLSEKILIDILGMSKTPIKSALERLESEGFITVWPKQGILVNDLSISQIKDIYELRMALEILVCNSLSSKLNEDHYKKIEENLAIQKVFAKENLKVEFTKADADFHLLLFEFYGNKEMHQIMITYHELLRRSALKAMKRVPERMNTSIEEHSNIFQALKKGNSGNAEFIMKQHLDFGLQAQFN